MWFSLVTDKNNACIMQSTNAGSEINFDRSLKVVKAVQKTHKNRSSKIMKSVGSVLIHFSAFYFPHRSFSDIKQTKVSFVPVALRAAPTLKNPKFCMYLIFFTLQNCLIWLVLSIGSMLVLLVLKNAVECTSQRLKWTSGARVMIIFHAWFMCRKACVPSLLGDFRQRAKPGSPKPELGLQTSI